MERVPERPLQRDDPVTAEELISAFGQMAERAHTHGIKVIGATLTPYTGAKYASPEGEAMRQAINKWIRTTNQLDGVIEPADAHAQDAEVVQGIDVFRLRLQELQIGGLRFGKPSLLVVREGVVDGRRHVRKSR